MDANERANKFFSDLILEPDSEIRNGCIYLIARVVHEGMEHQKAVDAEIARAWADERVAKAIENQTMEAPKPVGIFNKLFFWKKAG